MSAPGHRVGVGRWLAGAGAPLARAGQKLVALSPHLDDAVLSVGASLAYAARTGVSVTVLTVFAGDPESREPPSEWDARAGFASAGEAATARRREDVRACRLLGAEAKALRFSDADYERRFSDADVVAALASDLAGADAVLLPGAPLVHPDHALLNRLASAEVADERLVLYAEQPYALWADNRLSAWTLAPATLADRLTKLRACAAYRSQLALLGGRTMPLYLARRELRRGGEPVRRLVASES